jgi:glycosyltransferase involved in cell wall biosynthesis
MPKDRGAAPAREPVRVARIITRLNVGGPAIQAIALSSRLESAGYHTVLIHGRVGRGERGMDYLVPSRRDFELAYVPALQREVAPASDVAALARLVQLLRRFRPAIVHTHMAKAGSLGRLAAVLYNATAGRNRSARIVHTYHGHVLDGYFGARTVRALTAVERFLGGRSDALLAVSPRVREDLLHTHGIGVPASFRVVPLGLDLAAPAAAGPAERASARRVLELEEDAHVVTFVGRLTAIKRPELFLEAAARVSAADPRARFLVAGGGELDQTLRTQASVLGVAGRMRFLGWQNDLVPIYAASDLLAVTSRNEGTPVALIESMAAGVPGVCFGVGGVPDVITGPELGVVIAEGDVEGLARALGALLHDDAARVRMGAHARAHVLGRYGIDRLVRDIDGLYRQLL